MKKIKSLICIFALISVVSNGQFVRQNQDSIRQLTQQDYKKMLELLKITSTRPGLQAHQPHQMLQTATNQRPLSILPCLIR